MCEVISKGPPYKAAQQKRQYDKRSEKSDNARYMQ